MLRPPNCPYCGAEPVLREAEEIYGKPYGRVWVCCNFPTCDTLVGCHAHTSRPLGSMAGRELRLLRQQAHGAFDGWWRRRRYNRNKAYKALSAMMHIPQKECHIGMMNEDQCRRLIKLYSRKEGEDGTCDNIKIGPAPPE